MIVVVARDRNVEKIKGRVPSEDENNRRKNIVKRKIANQVILGQLRDRYKIIKKYIPDIICLGYDQRVDMEKLKSIFKGRIVKLRPYKENIYKSSKLA